MMMNAVQTEQANPVEMLINYISSWHCLKSAVSWLLKLKDLLLSLVRQWKQLRETLSKAEVDSEQIKETLNIHMAHFKAQVRKYVVKVEDLAAAEKAIIQFGQSKIFRRIVKLGKGSACEENKPSLQA